MPQITQRGSDGPGLGGGRPAARPSPKGRAVQYPYLAYPGYLSHMGSGLGLDSGHICQDGYCWPHRQRPKQTPALLSQPLCPTTHLMNRPSPLALSPGSLPLAKSDAVGQLTYYEKCFRGETNSILKL